MWRIAFGVYIAAALSAAAQVGAIPGRDLLAFPLGLTAEAAALGTQAGNGLWNPATVVLDNDARWRLSAAAMTSPTAISVSAQVGSVAGTLKSTTLAFTFARAAVDGLLRTDSDPQAIGNDITYSTIVLSLIAARRLSRNLAAGIALRNRSGRLDDISRTGIAIDAGVLAEHLTRLDVRAGASSFLFSPWAGNRERTSWLLAGDARLLGEDSTRTIRGGYALQVVQALSIEHFAFVSARWGPWEARGGPVRTETYGATNWRGRLGIAVRRAGYDIGISREESASGLPATYHFALSSVIR